MGMDKRSLMSVGSTPADTSLDDPFLRPNTNILILLQRGLLSSARDNFKQSIIHDMNTLGYFIEDIDFRVAPEHSGSSPGSNSILATFGSQAKFSRERTPVVAFIKERGVERNIDQFSISEGMWRALAVLIYLNFMRISSQIPSNRPSCIVIDDIGEGLDYDRSRGLIELVQQRAKDANVQLIMSTNDRFVMNSVPLENWTVLRRTGSSVKAYNYSNSKALFDEFKDTGLNNFDFLRMDFLNPEAQEDPLK
jgi:hypothetical protein